MAAWSRFRSRSQGKLSSSCVGCDSAAPFQATPNRVACSALGIPWLLRGAFLRVGCFQRRAKTPRDPALIAFIPIAATIAIAGLRGRLRDAVAPQFYCGLRGIVAVIHSNLRLDQWSRGAFTGALRDQLVASRSAGSRRRGSRLHRAVRCAFVFPRRASSLWRASSSPHQGCRRSAQYGGSRSRRRFLAVKWNRTAG